MKALDTNVLLRYLRDDDPAQSKKAARLIQRAVQQGEPLFLNDVVLCELVWVLDSVYEHSRREILETMHSILLTAQFEFENRTSIEWALADYRDSKADFADCLIGRRNRTLGVRATLSFDRKLKHIEGFEVI